MLLIVLRLLEIFFLFEKKNQIAYIRLANDLTDLAYHEERDHQEILKREHFPEGHYINARMNRDNSLFDLDNFDSCSSEKLFNNNPLQSTQVVNENTYSMMIKLIEGSLNDVDLWRSAFDKNRPIEPMGQNSIPTIASIATKAALEDGIHLDEKQIVTYETICSTFLLKLVNDGDDDSTSVGTYFANAAGPVTKKVSAEISVNSTEDQVSETLLRFNETFLSQDSLGSIETHDSSTSIPSLGDHDSSRSSDISMNDNMHIDNDESMLSKSSTIISEKIKDNHVDRVREKLYALGAKEQLIMFLTGSAGAGKTTAVKLAQKFCFEFCRSVGSFWNSRTFLFTAYTGSAASCFGGVTICKAAFLCKRKATLDQDEIDQWKDVRVLVVDEISFMKDVDMIQLDRRLKQCSGDRMKPFGGYSIIFAGDFRQLEPGGKPEQLLFSQESSHAWADLLNAVVILQSDHRFKEDPQYGKLLQRMWEDDLGKKDRQWLNERTVGSVEVPVLPDDFGGLDVVYAAPKNTERNSISAGNFKRHILETHPNIDSSDVPPNHTVIVEANITSSVRGKKNKKNQKCIGGHMRHRIITTCGDAKILTGNKKHVDPALCLYVGAHVLCIIDNGHLTNKVPRGNGTLCRVCRIKFKETAPPCRWKNYYGRKVNTALASDIEWIELEHYPKSKSITLLEDEIESQKELQDQSDLSALERQEIERVSQKLKDDLRKEKLKYQFRLAPQNFYVTVLVKPHSMAPVEHEMKCNMIQLPINMNDATTGHKLQGMSKDVVIITSWPKGGLFKNWEYVVLSRVRTRKGLYLFEPIDMNKSFKPSPELSLFFRDAKKKEQTFFKERQFARDKLSTKSM